MTRVWSQHDLPSFASNPSSSFDKVKQIVNDANLTDEQIVKLTAQLEYHAGVDGSKLLQHTQRICDNYSPPQEGWKFPTKRFGKTEINMPVVTMGLMRIQQTWCPDNLPIAITRKGVEAACQENLINCVRKCLKLGGNHFETARAYGSSEFQVVDALCYLMEKGEVKREDFIIQTKIPPKATNAEFEKAFNLSYEHMKRLKYIDLFSMHGVSKASEIERCKMHVELTDKWKAEGKIKHVGFSTHGTPDVIRKIIETNIFEYVNIHCTYFGSYHASGLNDNNGGYGNYANVKLAKEKDMGVLIISPFDKGGKLYRPTPAVVDSVGEVLSPIEFQSLYCWAEIDADTITIGIARESDFDEAVSAARKFLEKPMLEEMKAAKGRLDARWQDVLGSGASTVYNGIPSHHDKICQGVAFGHCVWLNNLVKVFGMTEFASDRYGNIKSAAKKWDEKKDFQFNFDKWNPFNTGTSLREGLSFDTKWPNQEEHLKIAKELDEKFGGNGGSTVQQHKPAYSLSTWEEFPGEDVSIPKVVMQNLSRKFLLFRCLKSFGVNGGPKKHFRDYAEFIRSLYRSN